MADDSNLWVEVNIVAEAGPALAAADYLVNFTGQGVLQEEVPGSPELLLIKGYLAGGPELENQQALLRGYAAGLSRLNPEAAPATLEFRGLESQDWAGMWRKHFKPRLVTNGLLVAPPWEVVRPRFGQRVVIIDPGQAFGTGQHETTVLCLQSLERYHRHGILPLRLLDVGTGSGILALAALLYGVERAVGIDIDPLAVEAAQHNARLNGLSQRLSVSTTPLDQVTEKFPLVLANLTAGDLINLAPQLVARLDQGGQLVASGMLAPQAQAVKETMTALGLSLLEEDSMSGWSALVME